MLIVKKKLKQYLKGLTIYSLNEFNRGVGELYFIFSVTLPAYDRLFVFTP